jgi:hypothetical protein
MDRWGGRQKWAVGDELGDKMSAAQEKLRDKKERRERNMRRKKRLEKQRQELAILEMDLKVSQKQHQALSSSSLPCIRSGNVGGGGQDEEMRQRPWRSPPRACCTDLFTNQEGSPSYASLPSVPGYERKQRAHKGNLRNWETDVHDMLRSEADRPWRQHNTLKQPKNTSTDLAQSFSGDLSQPDGLSWRRQLKQKSKQLEKDYYTSQAESLRASKGSKSGKKGGKLRQKKKHAPRPLA